MLQRKICKVTNEINLPPHKPCALARWLIRERGGFVVWDTETTGLEDDAKIVSIGIVDHDGNVLVDTLINPGEPIPRDATHIHGVTDEMVANAPTFEDVYPQIYQALQGERWVIYNEGYDTERLRFECVRYWLPQIVPAQIAMTDTYYGCWRTHDRREVYCVMQMFSEVYGDFSEYWGNFKWQRLTTAGEYYRIDVGNAHNALHDALTTLQVIKAMAMDEDKEIVR